MKVSLVLTIVGKDRPGIVDLLSRTLLAHRANWEESRMARLSGKFAGILLTSVPSTAAAALMDALRGLREQDLVIGIESADGDSPPAEWATLQLVLTGTDRPGIVQEVTRALARLKVTIEALETERKSAPWDGALLFHASAVLRTPPEVSVESLRRVLEAIADDLAVEIALQPQKGL